MWSQHLYALDVFRWLRLFFPHLHCTAVVAQENALEEGAGMTMVTKLRAWDVVLRDVLVDLQNKKREFDAIKMEVDRLSGIATYLRDQVNTAQQRDLFPFVGCRTTKEAVRVFFEIHDEPARVPEIATALVAGGYSTTARRFNDTVRMALLRMEEETEVMREGVYWRCVWESGDLDNVEAFYSSQRREETEKMLPAGTARCTDPEPTRDYREKR